MEEPVARKPLRSRRAPSTSCYRCGTVSTFISRYGERPPSCPALQRDPSERRWRRPGRGGRRPSGHPSQAALVHADCGRGHLPSEDRQEQVPSSLLYFKSEPSGEGWPTRAGERPAPWTLPQNLIDEARVLADGRIPLPEPERVPWDVLIAQAVNWDIPERLAA